MKQGKCPKCGCDVSYDCITDNGLEEIDNLPVVYYNVECSNCKCNWSGAERYKLVYVETVDEVEEV